MGGQALELDLTRPVLARSRGSLGTRGRLAEGRERRRRGAGRCPQASGKECGGVRNERPAAWPIPGASSPPHLPRSWGEPLRQGERQSDGGLWGGRTPGAREVKSEQAHREKSSHFPCLHLPPGMQREASLLPAPEEEGPGGQGCPSGRSNSSPGLGQLLVSAVGKGFRTDPAEPTREGGAPTPWGNEVHGLGQGGGGERAEEGEKWQWEVRSSREGPAIIQDSCRAAVILRLAGGPGDRWGVPGRHLRPKGSCPIHIPPAHCSGPVTFKDPSLQLSLTPTGLGLGWGHL